MRKKHRRFSEIAGRHAGEDVFVICAGPSAGFVAPEFFAGRTTICVNFAWQHFPATYCATTIEHPLRRALKSRVPWIVPDRNRACRPERLAGRPGVKWFVGRGVRVDSPDDARRVPLGPGDLIVGPTSALTAIHAAAILGARAVFVVGLDGGAIDGRWRFDGYRAGFYAKASEIKRTGDRANVPTWLAVARALRDRLAADYGCRVVGFNPFLGFDLDGHDFQRA